MSPGGGGVHNRENKMKECFRCAKNDSEVPLITLQYHAMQIFICPQCMPALIHHPEDLIDRLKTTISPQK